MTLLFLLGIMYLAMLATVYWHEFGHFGDRTKIDKWFPWIQGRCENVKYQYGGLAANFVGLYLIFYLKPENLFLQLFGFFNWMHFILYTICGSFNHEIDWPQHMWDKVVFDDIPNKYFFVFIPLGVVTFWLFKDFYFQIIVDAFRAVI